MIILSFLFIAIPASGSTTDRATVTCGEDWSWDTNANNTFEGELDLSSLSENEIRIRISSDLAYSDAEESESGPVFTSVNGKRITVMKQSDTIRIEKSEQETLSFSGRLRLPGKQHVHGITFSFCVMDENEIEIETLTAKIGGGEAYDGAFYIPADINRISLIIGTCAAAVWSLVFFRNRRIKKNRKGV